MHVEIPEKQPFRHDKFNRESIADNLETIIASTSRCLVISIDAGWGKGKTTFVKMWEQKLRNKGDYITLYFNAWENDDSDDPLLALISEFEEALPGSKGKAFAQKLKTCGGPLLKKLVPAALRVMTHGLLDLERIKLDAYTEEQLKQLAGSLGEAEFKKYAREKEAKKQFKDTLRDYQQKEGKKVILFIDELDRCRPGFAVEMLERIKHLFDIDEYVFILSIDKTQLKHSIKMLYGQDMDASGYLRRFIDLEYVLPEPDRAVFLEDLFGQYNLRNKNTPYLEACLKAYVDAFDLSLRDIEKLMYYMSLLLPLTPFAKEANFKPVYLDLISVIYAFFPVLRFANSEQYYRFISDSGASRIEEAGRLEEIRIPGRRPIEALSLLNEVMAYKTRLRHDPHIPSQTIGNADSLRDHFDLAGLVDKQTREFHFVRQMQFLESFNLD